MSDFFKTIGTGFIGIIGYLLGDIDGLLIALLVAMLLDFITGIIVAIIQKKLSSNICSKGIAKKVLMLFIVVVGHLIDTAVIGDGATVRNLVIIFYLANECISLLENSAALGVKYPDKLIQILQQLRDKGNGGSDDDSDDNNTDDTTK